MTTTYDRMRAAADNLDNYSEDCLNWSTIQMLATALRADADRLEACEREMQNTHHECDERPSLCLVGDWADRIRGETP